MKSAPNAQFNFAEPDSLAVRVATKVRRDIFRIFMGEVQPRPSDLVLDLGVTSDQTYSSSNYFEALYPYKDHIVAAGLQDASFLEQLYPGVRYLQANALDLLMSARKIGSEEALRVGLVNKVFAQSSQLVNTSFQWSPISDYVFTQLQNQLASAVQGKITFDQALHNTQSTVVTYAQQQGFTVSG